MMDAMERDHPRTEGPEPEPAATEPAADEPLTLVCVYEARDAVCANLLRIKLETEGIPVEIDQEDLGPLTTGFSPAFAAPRLWVAKEHEREAVRVLAEVGRERAERRAREG